MRTYFHAIFVLAATHLVWAADVPIINPGFEQVVLTCAPGPTCLGPMNVTGWTGTGRFATLKPSTGAGGIYPGGLPDGVNVAALGDDTGNGVLTQTLGVTLQPNTTYTLSYSVGSRADAVFAGYNVELLAGNTVLASESSLTPTSGTFANGRIVFSTGASPAQAGQTIGIRLTGNARTQANFDRISLDASPTSITSAVSQIASGGAWKTTMTLLNLSPNQITIRVAFRGDNGQPLTLPLLVTQQGAPQAAVAASVEQTIPGGATLLIESEAPVSAATQVGWAEITSSGPVSGFAIFRQRSPDGRESEGTSPVETARSSRLLLPFDNTAGFATSAALVNMSNQPVIISAVIRDANGAQIGLQAVALPPMGHTSFALPERFAATAARRGTVEFQNPGGGTITGLGLRFAPSNAFTSVPVVASQSAF